MNSPQATLGTAAASLCWLISHKPLLVGSEDTGAQLPPDLLPLNAPACGRGWGLAGSSFCPPSVPCPLLPHRKVTRGQQGAQSGRAAQAWVHRRPVPRSDVSQSHSLEHRVWVPRGPFLPLNPDRHVSAVVTPIMTSQFLQDSEGFVGLPDRQGRTWTRGFES